MVVPLLKVLLGISGIILLVVTYAYLDKLEKIGCECARHKYQGFIKNYALFAIAYLALTMVLPEALIAKNFGEIGSLVFSGLNLVFVLATFVFFVLAMIYAKYLMTEKCRCSEDMRREILYYWSIVEIALLGAIVVVPIFFHLVSSAAVLVFSTIDDVRKSSGKVKEAVLDPIKTARKFPSALKRDLKSLQTFKA